MKNILYVYILILLILSEYAIKTGRWPERPTKSSWQEVLRRTWYALLGAAR